MLKRLQIKHFRSCKDVVLDNLGSMTALVGRNGSGKTNILRAIEWLARSAKATDLSPASSDFNWMPGATAVADIACEGRLYRYALHVRLEPLPDEAAATIVLQESLASWGTSDRWETVIDRRGAEARLAGRDEPIVLGSLAPCLPALAALLPATEEVHRHVQPILAFLRTTGYYPFDETSEVTGPDSDFLISVDHYRQWASQYRSTRPAEDSVIMRLLYAHHESQEQFDEIQSLLGPKGLDLIERIVVNRIQMGGEQVKQSPKANRTWLP